MTMLYSVRMPRVLVYPLAAVALVALTVAGPTLAGPSLDDVVRRSPGRRWTTWSAASSPPTAG